jgi:hypothetical protein
MNGIVVGFPNDNSFFDWIVREQFSSRQHVQYNVESYSRFKSIFFRGSTEKR